MGEKGGGGRGREGAGNEAATAIIKNWICCHGYMRHNVPSMVKFVNCMSLTQWTEVANIVLVGKTRSEINKIWL